MRKIKQDNYFGILSLALLTFIIILISCTQPSQSGIRAIVNNYNTLVGNLVDANVGRASTEEIDQSFFSVKGKVAIVNEENIQVFEYDNENSAYKDASQVSLDGTSIKTSMVTWTDNPHFYRNEKIIVLYIGHNEKTIKILEGLLGYEFAGGKLSSINSFEECEKAGFLVMESLPPKCKTSDGRIFIEGRNQEKLQKTIQTERGDIALSYENGKTKLSGSLMRSTPCVEWDMKIISTKDLPISHVNILIFDKNKGIVCVQVLGDPQGINTEISSTSERTVYGVKLEDDIIFSGGLEQK